MNTKIYRMLPAFFAALLLVALVSCSGSETPQGTSATQSEETTAVGQNQPNDQQPQPTEEMSKTEEPQTGAVQQETQPSETSETAEKAAESQQAETSEATEITGTVIVSDSGVVIQTDQEELAVSGQDLTDMAGKKVKIVGTIQEIDGRRTIQVISVSEAQ